MKYTIEFTDNQIAYLMHSLGVAAAQALVGFHGKSPIETSLVLAGLANYINNECNNQRRAERDSAGDKPLTEPRGT